MRSPWDPKSAFWRVDSLGSSTTLSDYLQLSGYHHTWSLPLSLHLPPLLLPSPSSHSFLHRIRHTHLHLILTTAAPTPSSSLAISFLRFPVAAGIPRFPRRPSAATHATRPRSNAPAHGLYYHRGRGCLQ